MKRNLFSSILAIAAAGTVAAESPRFGAPIFQDAFAVEFSPSPTIVDWDNDGLNDIIAGYAYLGLTANKGTLAFLKNVGTNTDPQFERQDDIRVDRKYLLTGWDA